jgi:alginate O-acetyltransferase complex protein AlgI
MNAAEIITGFKEVRRTERSGTGLIWKLAALFVPGVVVGVLGRGMPGWVLMWVSVAGVFAGAKLVTLVDLGRRREAGMVRLVGYLMLWSGMDAGGFCGRRVVGKPRLAEWGEAMGRVVLGMGLVWLGVPALAERSEVAAGWVGMVGLALVLHFGVLNVLSLGWRTAGVNARPIMVSPMRARTLGEFWGGRWNRAFSDLMERHFLVPLARRVGTGNAILTIFFVSGLLHELVISVPARGGYGLPTIYFVVQGVGLLVERRWATWKGTWGQVFAVVVAGGPAFWLFHPVFIHNVLVPMFRSIGVL